MSNYVLVSMNCGFYRYSKFRRLDEQRMNEKKLGKSNLRAFGFYRCCVVTSGHVGEVDSVVLSESLFLQVRRPSRPSNIPSFKRY